MEKPQRKAMRLGGFDYQSPGQYFITICTYQSMPLLAKSLEGNITHTWIGLFVGECWKSLGSRYSGIVTGPHVVMPNHFHGMIKISDENEIPLHSLPDMIRNFKAYTAHEYYSNSDHRKLWQRGYHEHVIRDAADQNRIDQYIQNNPANWLRDKYYLE